MFLQVVCTYVCARVHTYIHTHTRLVLAMELWMNGDDHMVEIGLLSQQHNSLPVFASYGPRLQMCVFILKYGWTKFLVGQVIIMPIIQNTSCKYEPGHRGHFSLKLLWGWCPYWRKSIGLATQLPVFSRKASLRSWVQFCICAGQSGLAFCTEGRKLFLANLPGFPRCCWMLPGRASGQSADAYWGWEEIEL